MNLPFNLDQGLSPLVSLRCVCSCWKCTVTFTPGRVTYCGRDQRHTRARASHAPFRLHWEIMPIHSRRFYCGKSALHNSGCVFSPYLGIFVGSFNPKEFKEFWMSSRAWSIYIRLFPVLQAPIRYWPHNIMNIMRKWQK